MAKVGGRYSGLHSELRAMMSDLGDKHKNQKATFIDKRMNQKYKKVLILLTEVDCLYV